MKENIKEKISRLYARYGVNLLLTMGVIGIALISFGDLSAKPAPDKEAPLTLYDYRETLENDMEELLSKISGAGEVNVMITFESGRENIYVMQEKTSSDEKDTKSYDEYVHRSTYENEIVMVASGGDKNALIEKTIEPVVQGVVVVCTGADDIKVTSDITNAVSVAMNITTNRICVIKMD